MSELPNISWKKWLASGGCHLSDISRAMVSRRLDMPPADWEREGVTLAEIAEAWAPAGRELERFADGNYRDKLDKPRGQ